MSSWFEISQISPCTYLTYVGRTLAVLVCLLTFLYVLPLLDSQCGCRAENNASTLSRDTVWKHLNSPYLVHDDLLIPSGTILTIEAGTKILFGARASLVIEGTIIAVGTLDNPILFSSANPNPAPGDWGCLRFNCTDSASSNAEDQNRVNSSRLKYCIIEYGGQPGNDISGERFTGAIHCRRSSPVLENLIIRYNRSLRGGGVYCYEFSSPRISSCLFLENEAVESGGGLASFFYSNPRIENNVFQANRATRHGGAIYCSFSSPRIIDNIIQNNTAGSHGGGFYFSNMVTQRLVLVQNNVLLSNRAENGSNSVFLSAGIEAIFQDNCLLANGGYDIYVNALEKDLDFSGNYFGPSSATNVELIVYDEIDDPEQRTVIIDPVLDAPPEHAPNAAQDIISIAIYGDNSFSSEWPWPICADDPVYIEVRALDRNPYHADWIPLHLWVNSNPLGFKVLAWETGPSTGIYRFIGRVGSPAEIDNGTIVASVGDTLHCRIYDSSGFEIQRIVEEPENYSSRRRTIDENRSIDE